MYSTPSLSTALSCLKCNDGIDTIFPVLMRINALFNLVRSLRSEASWRNAAMESRPRAAISQIFQWTLILIQQSETTRGNSSALSLRRSQLFKKHTLWYPPHEESRAKLLLMLLLLLQLLSQNSRKPISHDKILWQWHTVRGIAHYQHSVLPAFDHTVEFLWLILIKSVAQNKNHNLVCSVLIRVLRT